MEAPAPVVSQPPTPAEEQTLPPQKPGPECHPLPWRSALLVVLRGMLMGAADAVPGVSGGTMALVTGIYQRLIVALSRFDAQLVQHLLRRRWRRAFYHVDGWFLALLGLGVALGWVGLAKTMRYLIHHHPLPTKAAFFGMVAASGVVVLRMVPRWSAAAGGTLALGALAGYLATSHLQVPLEPGLGFVFLAGAVAICAMILPGISGMYLLVILGMYRPVVETVDRLSSARADGGDLLFLLAFATGAALGLLSFVKLLRWLIHHHKGPTMAALLGLMLGSLHGLWPWGNGTGGTSAGVGVPVVIMAVSFAAVFGLELAAGGRTPGGRGGLASRGR